jgi:hypothetical protein
MISLWVFIIVVIILLGMLINEIRITSVLKSSYDELESDNRRITMELGYMRLRYGKSSIKDMNEGIGLPPEITKLIKNKEA